MAAKRMCRFLALLAVFLFLATPLAAAGEAADSDKDAEDRGVLLAADTPPPGTVPGVEFTPGEKTEAKGPYKGPESEASRMAFLAHRGKIRSFNQLIKGLGIAAMGNQALADMSVKTEMAIQKKDGEEFLEVYLANLDPLQELRDRTYERYAWRNAYSDEWNVSYNDPYKILEDSIYIAIIWPEMEPSKCPTYYYGTGSYRVSPSGSISAMRLDAYYCVAWSYLHYEDVCAGVRATAQKIACPNCP